MVSALALAGCAVCNDLFYIPTLNFVLSQSAANQLVDAASSEISTCINTTCWSNTVDASGSNAMDVTFDPTTRQLNVTQFVRDGGTVTAVNGQTGASVSLTVSRDGGTVFTHEWNSVAFEVIEPNGPGCGVAYKLKSPLTF